MVLGLPCPLPVSLIYRQSHSSVTSRTLKKGGAYELDDTGIYR